MKNIILIILIIFLSIGAVIRNIEWGKGGKLSERSFAERWIESTIFLIIILFIAVELD